jgi:hypothetical protein
MKNNVSLPLRCIMGTSIAELLLMKSRTEPKLYIHYCHFLGKPKITFYLKRWNCSISQSSLSPSKWVNREKLYLRNSKSDVQRSNVGDKWSYTENPQCFLGLSSNV